MYNIDSLKIEKFNKIFKKYNICPICIYRLTYNIDKNFIKNFKNFYKNLKTIKFYRFKKSKKCYLCNNILIKLKEIVYEILIRIESYDFKSFIIGTSIPSFLQAREDFIRARYNIFSGTSLKSFLNYFLSYSISRMIKKKVDHKKPDIKLLYDFNTNNLEITPSSIYVYGRYLKLKRGVRQTRQFCSFCHRLGCKYCNYKGYTDDPSIEGYLLNIFRDEFLGEESILHAAGREDIDVITINLGRPFVIEIKRPLKRNVNLKELQNKLNSININIVILKNLQYVDREIMEKINVYSKYDEKTYRLIVRFKEKINEKILKKVESELNNKTIAQRTPIRVLKRRADKIRYKQIYSINSKMINEYEAEFIIRCQGGLYVKELAHGDQGRTIPSIYSITCIPLEVVSLDVISISPELEVRLGLDYI